ncbi:fibroblast growth factor receptor-like [Contarinia nasturtii]|uniref:fibroblast growth factor receptor-like n=1 Tax=Contarinia nasturtii TaxID=265458 RepID=UPI0012D4A452|nr:fibroblast growth factor receptor-like [Contarinia nasturtii]
MHYITSRNILHRDLAARNVLLCTNNVVKICDFGLARDLHKNGYYRTRGEEKVPMRWLALESLNEPKYSVHSDVWSFGIVLWELFSLGELPYSEEKMHTFGELEMHLKDGHRLSKPQYATQTIYDIMRSCWNADAKARPLFDNLEKKISELMEPGVVQHFIDLSKSYLESHVSQNESGEMNFISQMTSPVLDENAQMLENSKTSSAAHFASEQLNKTAEIQPLNSQLNEHNRKCFVLN